VFYFAIHEVFLVFFLLYDPDHIFYCVVHHR